MIHSIRVAIHICIFFMISLTVAYGIFQWVTLRDVRSAIPAKDQEVLLSFAMKETNWRDIGVVPEPLVALEIKTPEGYKEHPFLLDSGAVISSLPREWAHTLGYDLALLPRSTFGGFGGLTSTAYQGEMEVKVGEEDIVLPVVFTEATGVKSLLGRKGFFNRYSIFFDHTTQRVEIRK